MSTSIYTGKWTDHSYGETLGTRVTISSKNAKFLIAFIALFDTLVGTLFWNLMSFSIHQYRARNNSPREGLFHQIQVLLRNSNEPISFAQNAFLGGWRWRRRARRAVFYQAMLLALLALFTAVLFSAIGILSSQIATSGNVLLTGVKCGFINATYSEDTAQEIVNELQYGQQLADLLRESILYAQSCYANPLEDRSLASTTSFSPGADCDFYVKPTLNWTTEFGVPCPFADPRVCSVPSSDIIQMDTGLLDSNDDLGLNTKNSDRVLFRRVTTCSPMSTDGFTNNLYERTELPGVYAKVAVYSYGPSFNQPIPCANASILVSDQWNEWIDSNNVTFIYPESSYNASDVPYLLSTQSRLSMSYVPDTRVALDANLPVSLFFLANRADFISGPVEDPWFHATEYRLDNVTGDITGYLVPSYYTTTPGSLLGCVEQMQVCNPNGTQPVCSGLNETWSTSSEAFTGLGMNALQSNLATNLVNAMLDTSFFALVSQGAQEVLLASGMVYDTPLPYSLPLPSNQWQIEVEHWMAIANAWMQRTNLYQITGPTEEALASSWQLISSPETLANTNSTDVAIYEQLCAAQKIRSTAYQSFSLLGLCINFTIGSLITIAGLAVKYMFPASRKRRSTAVSVTSRGEANNSRQQAWIEEGDWEDDDDAVPITKRRQLFPRPTVTFRHGYKAPRSHYPRKIHSPLVKQNASGKMFSSRSTVTTFGNTSSSSSIIDFYAGNETRSL